MALSNTNIFDDFNNKTDQEKQQILDFYKKRRDQRPSKKAKDWGSLINDPDFLLKRKLFSMPLKKAFALVRKPEVLLQFKTKLALRTDQFQMLSGMMLGDGGMRRSSVGTDWSFKICQAHNKHKAYAFHIYDQLYYYSLSMPLPVLRKNSLEWQWDTISHPAFTAFHQDWYKLVEGVYKKRVPTDFATKYLSDRALAYWYMDDGYLLDPKGIGKAVAFATHGFEDTEVQILCQALKEKYEWEVRTKLNKGKSIIIIEGQHDQEFLEVIGPHYHESMRYKLPTPRKR